MAGKNVTTVIYRFDGHNDVKEREKTEHRIDYGMLSLPSLLSGRGSFIAST